MPQALPAVTHTVPEAAPKVTVANLVPCPDVIVAPIGTVHVYTEVEGTLETEYITPASPLQTVVDPFIPPGIAGALAATETARQFCELVLQLLLASTQIFPAVFPKVTVTAAVPCPAVMLAPEGTVQL